MSHATLDLFRSTSSVTATTLFEKSGGVVDPLQSHLGPASSTCGSNDLTELEKPYDVRMLPYECINKHRLREILVNRKLRHPHIIRQHAIVDEDRRICIINEHARCGTMLDYILKNKKLEETEARWYFQQIIIALHFTHHLGLPHDNLNPQNILLTLNPARPRSRFHHAKLTGFASTSAPPPARYAQTGSSSCSSSSPSNGPGCSSSSSKAARQLSCSYFFSAPEARSPSYSASCGPSSSCLDFSSPLTTRSSSMTSTNTSRYAAALPAAKLPEHSEKSKSSIRGTAAAAVPAGQTTARPPLGPTQVKRAPHPPAPAMPAASSHQTQAPAAASAAAPAAAPAAAVPAPAAAAAAAAAAAGFQADMWSCGVLLFAMLTGHLPLFIISDLPSHTRRRKFTPTSPVQMMKDIPRGLTLSPDCLLLLTKLLHPNPEARITLEGVLRHPWFLRGLPPGALAMNEKLLNKPPPAVQSLQDALVVLERGLIKGIMQARTRVVDAAAGAASSCPTAGAGAAAGAGVAAVAVGGGHGGCFSAAGGGGGIGPAAAAASSSAPTDPAVSGGASVWMPVVPQDQMQQQQQDWAPQPTTPPLPQQQQQHRLSEQQQQQEICHDVKVPGEVVPMELDGQDWH